MAQNHGARQQKRAAKQKAKRLEKRARLLRLDSKDPTIRLAAAASWPVVQAVCSSELWSSGIGSLAIARRESDGGLVFAVFLVDAYCLGVKNAFWKAGTHADFRELIDRLEKTQPIGAIDPACLKKIVQGAVEYAKSFGFAPHSDYRHASMLLEGIDPTTCPQQFTFGHDGKPLYVQGPHESSTQAAIIMQRIHEAGGHYLISARGAHSLQAADFEDDDSFDDLNPADDEKLR
jgi:hypothetical protein